METVIRKWGNSPAVRLPGAVLEAAGYSVDQRVELIVRKGRIVIQPARQVEYDLQALIDGITPENSHAEADFGEPVGREAL